MVKSDFLNIISNSNNIEASLSKELKKIVDAHPYFQPARALYLKALKNQESFKYNNELKVTAAYTTDRTILFDYITSFAFNKVTKSKPTNTATTHQNSNIETVKEQLHIGKPIPFTKHETHSFQQWLQLSTHTPIIRTQTQDNAFTKQKSIKEEIINRFIESNPKISPIKKNTTLHSKPAENESQPLLMTETLAKVYLEQKKYDSAIKAYEILSLKYPEKSGFFADQIKRIQILQKI
ncbi:hypothetical protein [Tenacibaculum sp. IB213877]|uniref:hypothetical protein n=1 Tax=Tenacibaculum sp. IB213877 TaxID=3097351 RepID=UPI002A5AD7BA|nr:hypothetical protein [Tenacibaculum sp. IB213877]MDY0780244.1 hypothetical protein [Tenacibaculum sp. IB213877]